MSLTQKKLKRLLAYNPETGKFVWLARPGKKGKGYVGTEAGSRDSAGYIQINIEKHAYRAHRLAFLYMTGRFPKIIDHQDRIRDNNKWANLREVSNRDNCRNISIRVDNVSGCHGVSWIESRRKWQVHIIGDGKKMSLGRYASKEDAIKVRKEAEKKFGYHPNHGVAHHV